MGEREDHLRGYAIFFDLLTLTSEHFLNDACIFCTSWSNDDMGPWEFYTFHA